MKFRELVLNAGRIRCGFPGPVDFVDIASRTEYAAETLQENLLFGTLEQSIEKFYLYADASVDLSCYNPVFGLEPTFARWFLELSIERVMPAFASSYGPGAASIM